MTSYGLARIHDQGSLYQISTWKGDRLVGGFSNEPASEKPAFTLELLQPHTAGCEFPLQAQGPGVDLVLHLRI